MLLFLFFFFKQKTAYEVRISDWSSDVCSSDLYDSDSEMVVAEGHVEMNRDAISMRADKVSWNRRSGQVVAEGDVAIRNPEGDTAYGDRIELTGSLRDGVVEDLLVVLENGSRLAAVRGTRFENGSIELDNAAYTPCPVLDEAGCPKDPSWQIRAERVLYDRARNKVKYDRKSVV